MQNVEKVGYTLGDPMAPWRVGWGGIKAGFYLEATEFIGQGTVLTYYDGTVDTITRIASNTTVYNQLGLGSHAQTIVGDFRLCGKGVTPYDYGCGAFSLMQSSRSMDVSLGRTGPGNAGNVKSKLETLRGRKGEKVLVAVAS